MSTAVRNSTDGAPRILHLQASLRARDWIWLFASPLYLLLGTLRHEASHAIVGLASGAGIDWFHFWPRLTQRGPILGFGMVIFDRPVPWIVVAAPYLADLLCFAVTLYICLRFTFRSRALWINLIILGVVSPCVNSLFNYGFGEVRSLHHMLLPVLVHSYFIMTLALYVAGFFAVLALAPTNRSSSAATVGGNLADQSPRVSISLGRDLNVAIALGLFATAGEPALVAAGFLRPREEIRLVARVHRCEAWFDGNATRSPSERAESSCGQALGECRRAFGDTNAITVRHGLALAGYYSSHRRFVDAEGIYVSLLESAERALDDSHPLRLQTVGEFAEMLWRSLDYGRAARWFRQAAELGSPAGQSWLGYLHEHGQGVDRDLDEATVWYRRAAEQGHAYALGKLAGFHRQGTGVLQDAREAARLYGLAAEAGSREAQQSLGEMYQRGEGVSQDLARAAVWFERAAERGSASAQYELGVLYQGGRGVPQDDLRASVWFRKAAVQGFVKAYERLGDNARGRQQWDQAYAWFKLAADGGSTHAESELTACAERMTSEQIEAAVQASTVRALETSRRTRGSDDPKTLGLIESLGRSHLAREEDQAARKLFAELVERRSRLLGASHPDTQSAVEALATSSEPAGASAEPGAPAGEAESSSDVKEPGAVEVDVQQAARGRPS